MEEWSEAHWWWISFQEGMARVVGWGGSLRQENLKGWSQGQLRENKDTWSGSVLVLVYGDGGGLCTHCCLQCVHGINCQFGNLRAVLLHVVPWILKGQPALGYPLSSTIPGSPINDGLDLYLLAHIFAFKEIEVTLFKRGLRGRAKSLSFPICKPFPWGIFFHLLFRKSWWVQLSPYRQCLPLPKFTTLYKMVRCEFSGLFDGAWRPPAYTWAL